MLVSAPQRDGVVMPDQAALAAVMTGRRDEDAGTVRGQGRHSALLDTMPARGTVARTATRSAFGITEWELSNGVKVVLKPTTYKEDEVLFRAFSPGGTSLASDADFISADSASSVISAGGLGKFSALDLRKGADRKSRAGRSPYIDELDEGIIGSGSPQGPRDAVPAHLPDVHAAAGRQDLFSVMTSQTKSSLANRQSQPEYAFIQAREAALSQNHSGRGR